jgi:hypothetical protein
MSVVVDVNVFGLPVLLKSIKVYALFIILADVVTYYHVTVSSLHDTAEPHIVMAVVVLNEGVHAVVIGVKAASIPTVIPHIPISFVVLDSDPVCVKTENAVSRIVSTAIGQYVVFIDCVFTDPCNDVIAPGIINIIPRDIYVGPQIMTDRVMFAKLDATAGGGVSNAHASNPDNSVISDAKVMQHRGFEALYTDMDSSASLSGYFPVNIVYVAVVDVYMFVRPFRSFY